MKKYLVAAGSLLAIVLVVGGIKAVQIVTLTQSGEQVMPASVVTAMPVQEQPWEQTLKTVGTLESVQGVVVSADLSGRVTEILFTAGSRVKKGEVLLRQDTSSEQAQLRAADANAVLAKINLERVAKLLKNKVSSQSEYDTAKANYDQALADVDNIRTSIDKKSVKAPFDGRLGIRLVNVGSDLSSGKEIVSLQAVDPIYVNFSLPQRELTKLSPGLLVHIVSDAVPNQQFDGEITTINPEVDPDTRSVRVQATLSNKNNILLPGMYVNVDIVLPERELVLAVPSTAVLYATFGDSVFVVREEKDEKSDELKRVAQQQFVRLGRALGDFVSIEAGVSAGDMVVSTGVFRLRNGMTVEINNESQPDFTLDPKPKDS